MVFSKSYYNELSRLATVLNNTTLFFAIWIRRQVRSQEWYYILSIIEKRGILMAIHLF